MPSDEWYFDLDRGEIVWVPSAADPLSENELDVLGHLFGHKNFRCHTPKECGLNGSHLAKLEGLGLIYRRNKRKDRPSNKQKRVWILSPKGLALFHGEK